MRWGGFPPPPIALGLCFIPLQGSGGTALYCGSFVWVLPLASLALPLSCGSSLRFLSISWVMRSLHLPLLFFLFPSILRGFLPFLSRVLCSWLLLLLGGGGCTRGCCPPLWGSLFGVCLSCLCPLCVLSCSSGFWGRLAFVFVSVSLLVSPLVVALFAFHSLCYVVSFFWFPSLSAGGLVSWGGSLTSYCWLSSCVVAVTPLKLSGLALFCIGSLHSRPLCLW